MNALALPVASQAPTRHQANILLDLIRVQHGHAVGRLRAARSNLQAERDPTFALRLLKTEAISYLEMMAPESPPEKPVDVDLMASALEQLVVNIAAIAFELDAQRRINTQMLGAPA